MKNYQVFRTRAEAQAAVDAINDDPIFPITGYNRGKLAPNKQKTERWVDAQNIHELKAGGFAFPVMEDKKFSDYKIPVSRRDSYKVVHATDVRRLGGDKFVEEDEI